MFGNGLLWPRWVWVLAIFFAAGPVWSVPLRDEASRTTLDQDPLRPIRERIASADSAHDVVTGASTRLELAALSKPYAALKATQEAAFMLDSSDVSPELALRAHRELATIYSGLKAFEKADREWALVVRSADRLREDAAAALEQAERTNAVAQGRIDSLINASGVQRAAASNRLQVVVEEHEQRKGMALIAIAGGTLALLLAVFFFALHGRRMHADLKETRQEVTWLRMVSKKGTGPVAAPTPTTPDLPAPRTEIPQVPSTPALPKAGSFNPEEDAMLLALVRRRGEERLRTLRDARSRGDIDKVVRVVHSMKPQLVSFDATYFTDICGRLVTSDPRIDPAQWAADLDRFEAGMARVIGQRP